MTTFRSTILRAASRSAPTLPSRAASSSTSNLYSLEHIRADSSRLTTRSSFPPTDSALTADLLRASLASVTRERDYAIDIAHKLRVVSESKDSQIRTLESELRTQKALYAQFAAEHTAMALQRDLAQREAAETRANLEGVRELLGVLKEEKTTADEARIRAEDNTDRWKSEYMSLSDKKAKQTNLCGRCGGASSRPPGTSLGNGVYTTRRGGGVRGGPPRRLSSTRGGRKGNRGRGRQASLEL